MGDEQPPTRAARSPAPQRPPRVQVRIDGRGCSGPAIDLRPWAFTADTVVDAIYGRTAALTVRCAFPGPLFGAVGCVHEELSVSLPTVLATVARGRGVRTPRDAELATVRKRLAALSSPRCDLADERRRLACTGADEAALRERVAAARGDLTARREQGLDTADSEAALESAVAELTAAQTERMAAEQRLSRAQMAARDVRDRRERRLRLQDRAANLARAVRRDLANDLYDEFAAAVRAVSGTARPGSTVGAYDGDDVTAALAVLRMSGTATPVVLAVDRFPSPSVAARSLGVPVLRVERSPRT